MKTRRGNSEQRKPGASAREAVPLKEHLSKRLAAYAAAAGAAGVGLLAMAEPAKADIVYTPANVTFSSGSISIDLNQDGNSDFQFQFNIHSTYPFHENLSVNGVGNQGAGVVRQILSTFSGGLFSLARAMYAGSVIGQSRSFNSPPIALAYLNDYVYYNSFGPVGRFVGLQFSLGGQTHYGWAELQVWNPPPSATLLGFAYETNPNQSILAGQTSEATPEPATLGLLALGLFGLGYWRRRKLESEVRSRKLE